jgi:polysaccharide biosynthesis/export protein
MMAKKILSIFMAVLFFLPSTRGWSQSLEDQAQFYLQKIGPEQTPSQPDTSLSTRPPASSELPKQIASPPKPVNVMTSAPRQAEDISAIERRAWSQRMFITQFGYNFFYQPPTSFLPVEAVPVGPDYVIGPGDRIKIIIWGSVQGEYNLTVDRNGQVNIPKVGVVQVSSLTYQQLQTALAREFSQQYTNFQMNVTLDNLRTIQIYVVGQARFPGSYAVSSLATLINALFASGGPNKSGSLRKIQVRRGNKVVVIFDMYDFLLHGDKSKDIRLQAEDVIFIPPIGQTVAIGSPKSLKEIQEDLKITTKPSQIQGSELDIERAIGMSLQAAAQKIALSKEITLGGPVKVPAIYELKNEKTLADLVRLAGGLGDTAFKGRVQVLRVKGRQEMVLFNEDLAKALTKYQGLPLVDGDVVEIFPVPSLVEKKVAIAGAIKEPGEYGFREQMRVSDLINYSGGLLLQADKKEAEITRVRITPEGPETFRIYVKLYAALSGSAAQDVLLQPNDYLFIRTVADWGTYKTVKIAGEVKFPGTYTVKKGEKLSSLLARAGGFSSQAYLLGGVLTRESTKRIQKEQLAAAINRMEAEVLALAGSKAASGLDGEEAKRSEVYAKQQMQLLAGLRKVEPLGRVIIRLDDPERLQGTPEDIELEEADSLLVPTSTQTVNIVGAVFNPTAIVYTPYRTVGEYVTMSGGTTKIADDKEIYIIKVNGAAVSRKGFKWLGTSWDGTKYVYHPGGLGSLTLDPGDTIVVPEQLDKIEWLKQLKDIAAIIGNIALTAGVVLVGLKR